MQQASYCKHISAYECGAILTSPLVVYTIVSHRLTSNYCVFGWRSIFFLLHWHAPWKACPTQRAILFFVAIALLDAGGIGVSKNPFFLLICFYYRTMCVRRASASLPYEGVWMRERPIYSELITRKSFKRRLVVNFPDCKDNDSRSNTQPALQPNQRSLLLSWARFPASFLSMRRQIYILSNPIGPLRFYRR